MASSDDVANQKQAFAFLQEHFRTSEPFTRSDLLKETRWTERSLATYWSKQFEPFVVAVAPEFRGKARRNQKYRVTDVFLTVTVYDIVVMFDFFLPLTNEIILRNALDSLFYHNTLQKKLLTIGLTTLKGRFPAVNGETDADYVARVVGWVALRFGGYSIGQVNGRFRAGTDLLDFQSAAGLMERGGRYLIDETTAITRFIFPCASDEEAKLISWFFHGLFVESVVRVAGEAEVWMIESGLGQPRLHVWRSKD